MRGERAVLEQWRKAAAAQPLLGQPTLIGNGIALGAGTLLAHRETSESEEVLCALLAAAHGVPAPFMRNEAARIACASRQLASGDAQLADTTLRRYELRPLSSLDAAVCLMLAERALRADGIAPRTLLAKLGLDGAAMLASGRPVGRPVAPGVRSSQRLAKYSPNQPRLPAGAPGGGRWVSDGSPPPPREDAPRHAASPFTHGRFGIPREALERVLIDAGLTELEAKEWRKEVGRLIRDVSPDVDTLLDTLPDRLFDLLEVDRETVRTALHEITPSDAPEIFLSAFDRPKPLQALKTDKPPRDFTNNRDLLAYVGKAPPGYEWHHIIPQKQSRPDLTSDEGRRQWIHNTDNLVLIPTTRHWAINALMNNRGEWSRIRFRERLEKESPAYQRWVGEHLLNIVGASL